MNAFSRLMALLRRACSRGFDAEARGARLLEESLSPVQLQQYARCKYFEVVGGQTGKRYRIRPGRSMNVEELDKAGRAVVGLCFFPKHRLVVGDVMLAQKLALELFESEALAIAHRHPGGWHRIR